MIIVSAATGGLGRLVVECLLHRVPAGAVAVAVRNPGRADDLAARGVEVRFGDYDDLDSLGEAFTTGCCSSPRPTSGPGRPSTRTSSPLPGPPASARSSTPAAWGRT